MLNLRKLNPRKRQRKARQRTACALVLGNNDLLRQIMAYLSWKKRLEAERVSHSWRSQVLSGTGFDDPSLSGYELTQLSRHGNFLGGARSLLVNCSGIFGQCNWPSLHRLEALSLIRMGFLTCSHLSGLVNLPSLTAIEIGGCTLINDDIFPILGKIETLKDVAVMCSNKVTGVKLGELNGLKLRRLNLAGCKGLTDASVCQLASMKSLTELDLTGMQLTDKGLSSFAGLFNLHSLTVDRCNVTNHGFASLAHLPKVEKLSANMCEHLDDGFLAVISRWKLTELEVGFCGKFTDAGIANLGDMAGMQRLRLSNSTEITDASLELVAGCMSKLKVLVLDRCSNVTDRGLEYISSLPITELDLENCKSITDKGVGFVARLGKSLERLNLSDNHRLTDRGIELLVACQELWGLNLSYLFGISGRCCEALAHLPRLQSLNMSFCGRVTTKHALHLVHRKPNPINRLDFRGCLNVHIEAEGPVEVLHH